MAGSDFEGTSPKLFWPETLVYLKPGAELNQMLTLIVAMKSETPCEPELLLFAGMNDHVHAAGLLEPLRSGELTPKKIWEAIQTLFAAMNEVQELVTSRWGSKTRVVFASSPGYAIMPPILRFVYAMLILITEGNGEDISQTEELKFYSGLIIRIGARCFFCNQEGYFSMEQ